MSRVAAHTSLQLAHTSRCNITHWQCVLGVLYQHHYAFGTLSGPAGSSSISRSVSSARRSTLMCASCTSAAGSVPLYPSLCSPLTISATQSTGMRADNADRAWGCSSRQATCARSRRARLAQAGPRRAACRAVRGGTSPVEHVWAVRRAKDKDAAARIEHAKLDEEGVNDDA